MMALTPYSVSPRFVDHSRGPNPTKNSSTLKPKRFANAKCAASWIMITTISITTRATMPTAADIRESMHDPLGVNDGVDLRVLEIEQEPRLDDLEALVHERRGIDRDLRPHLPHGMRERLLHRSSRELASSPSPERPAGAGEDDALDVLAPFTP